MWTAARMYVFEIVFIFPYAPLEKNYLKIQDKCELYHMNSVFVANYRKGSVCDIWFMLQFQKPLAIISHLAKSLEITPHTTTILSLKTLGCAHPASACRLYTVCET